MTDYIRRDTAIELMKKEAAEMSESFEELGGESGIYADAYEDAANMLQDMAAADVAEVVRCRDCIYRIEGRCFSRTSFLNAPAVEPDNFCSWGATE